MSVSIIVFWLAAGQSFGNILQWIRVSIDLTSGYAESMNIEQPQGAAQYFIFAALVAVIIVQIVTQPGINRVSVSILAAWTTLVALKVGFTRHDLGHPTQSFTLLMAVCLALGASRKVWLPLLGAVVASATAISGWGVNYSTLIDPSIVMGRTTDMASALVSTGYRSQLLGVSRARIVEHYGLTPSVLKAIKGKTVHIDPQDANVAWAYRLNWNPVPIFQEYSAYTPLLDAINAKALTAKTGPQTVLRASLTGVDNRNPMWESPLYMQALVCNFSPTVESTKWLVLSRAENRCGAERITLGHESFSNGQLVTVPLASDGYMVIADFTLDQSAVNFLVSSVFKPTSSVFVSTNDGFFRLPRAHAAGPLILSLPASAGWATEFGGGTSTTKFELNVSGSVTFTAVPVRAKG